MDLSGYELVDFTAPAPIVCAPDLQCNGPTPEQRPADPRALQEPGYGNEMLRGWVNRYYVVVGGKRLGPYFVRRWKQNGKLCKEYVELRDVKRVKAACERYREKRKRERGVAWLYRNVAGNGLHLPNG